MITVIKFISRCAIKQIITAVVLAMISATIVAQIVIARPVPKELQKPYIMIRGDGDTINRKFFDFGDDNDGGYLTPPSSISKSRSTNNAPEDKKDINFIIISWMFLYQLFYR